MRFIAVILFLILSHYSTVAIPTRVMVRVKAKDAKFIGSSIGGAYVKISEVVSGHLLASGYTRGATGNTDVIMNQPHSRFGPLAGDNTAGFHAMMDIEKPVFVEVQVVAPVNQRQASVTASTQVWLIPGKHVEGDGIIIEIPGMIVNVLAPQTHENISVQALRNGFLEVRANVVMMCGCPITEDGLWDSNDVEVKALVSDEDGLLSAVPLIISDKPNTFEGKVPVKKPGNYEMVIYAYNSRTGNTGVDKVNIVASK